MDNYKDITQRVNLIDLAYSLSLLGKCEGTQVDAPCPKCGGTDRMGVMADRWFCRQCKPLQKGKRHDCIDFVIHIGKANNFKDAALWLADWLGGKQVDPVIAPKHETVARHDWESYAWQCAARNKMYSSTLGNGEGMTYLNKRGLTAETCNRWQIGYGKGWSKADKKELKSIIIPWFGRGQTDDCERKIEGINCRFLERDGEGKRYSRFLFPKSKEGSAGNMSLFRLIDGDSEELVICEGEFNALSVWQERKCHVVSVGSESFTDAAITEIAEMSTGYKIATIWTDKPNIAKQIAAVVQCPSRLVCSPVIRGEKYDANKLLECNMLGAFLDRLPRILPGREDAAAANGAIIVNGVGDVTRWVGRNVSKRLYDEITKRCNILNFSIEHNAIGDLFHITKIHAYPSKLT